MGEHKFKLWRPMHFYIYFCIIFSVLSFQKSLTSLSWICTTCWQVLWDFHKFYKRIEEAHECFTDAILKTEMQEIPEDEENYINIKDCDVETSVQEDTEHDHMEETLDQFLDNIMSNVKEKDKQPSELKLETSNTDLTMVEEVVVPVKRSSRLRQGDPLEKAKPDTKTSKTSIRKVAYRTKQKIVRKNKSASKTKTKAKSKTKTRDKDNEKSTEMSTTEDPIIDCDIDTPKDKDEGLHSDDTKTSLNYNYKPSVEHKEQDKFVAENFKIICGICQLPMSTFYDVSAHAAKEHNQRGFVKCCNKKFYRRIILVEHISWHLDPERFKCQECGKVLADRRCLQVHVRLHEQQDRNHICDVCGKGFARPVTLQRHKYTHIPEEERKIPCDQCDKK